MFRAHGSGCGGVLERKGLTWDRGLRRAQKALGRKRSVETCFTGRRGLDLGHSIGGAVNLSGTLTDNTYFHISRGGCCGARVRMFRAGLGRRGRTWERGPRPPQRALGRKRSVKAFFWNTRGLDLGRSIGARHCDFIRKPNGKYIFSHITRWLLWSSGADV